MMKKSSLTILILIFCFSSYSQGLVFKLNKRTLETISRTKLMSGEVKLKLGHVGSFDKTMKNVWRGYTRTYRGYSLFELLDNVYGESWRSARTISFFALDGYKQIANISSMLKKSKNRLGILAYRETGKNGFSTYIKKGKKIELGPYYLVWSNFTEKDKASHSDFLKWPYQLKTIEITN